MKTRRSRARISLVVVVIFAIVAVFVVRLVDIQVVQADELNAQSLSKRAQELTTYGVRGEIVDANGAVLANSVERYDIEASPRSALGGPAVDPDVTTVGAVLAGLGTTARVRDLSIAEPDIEDVVKRIYRARR